VGLTDIVILPVALVATEPEAEPVIVAPEPPKAGVVISRAIPPDVAENTAVGAVPAVAVSSQVALKGTGLAVVVPVVGDVVRPETPDPPVNVAPPTTSLETLNTPPLRLPADILYIVSRQKILGDYPRADNIRPFVNDAKLTEQN
jgi:hypothetical protein